MRVRKSVSEAANQRTKCVECFQPRNFLAPAVDAIAIGIHEVGRATRHGLPQPFPIAFKSLWYHNYSCFKPIAWVFSCSLIRPSMMASRSALGRPASRRAWYSPVASADIMAYVQLKTGVKTPLLDISLYPNLEIRTKSPLAVSFFLSPKTCLLPKRLALYWRYGRNP